MLKRLTRATQSPWICQRCLHQFRRQRRFNSTFAATAIARDAPPPPSSSLYGLSTSGKTDDDALRKVFDNAQFWQQFKRTSKESQPAGIIGNKYLTKPEGFVDFVTVTIQRCNAVVQKVAAAQTTEEFKNMVKDLDKLSDLLCRVIDLADFVRGTHPDRNFQRMAVKAYHTVFQYMNQLNTTPVLYDQLKRGSEIPEVYDAWTEEERIVARILMEDFARFGIGLDHKTRERLVDLSGEIAEVGSQFVESMAPAQSSLKFSSKRLKGLDPNLAKALTRWGETRISTMHQEAQAVLRFVEDPDVRRETYIATRTAGKASIGRLEKMLKLRAELAQLSGYETFGHMTLENKLARTPEAVNTFLKALYEDSRPAVLADLEELMELKRGDAHQDNYPDRINAWDKFYYTQKMLASMESYKQRTPDSLSAYFSVGTVLQGISRLFERLYGVRFVPKETQPGEVWEDDVRRLDVVSDTEGHIAVLYCDLYSRPGKTPNPAHFTLRCSREILSSEIEEMAHMQHRFSSPIEAATDGMPVSYNAARNSYFQLPTIALICDFSTPTSTSRPTLLNIHDVRTLFHEMGHALHSILGRTALQNVSGTRCATDIAELPSVLMEHFAFDPHVLSLYARHWDTDAPLPLGLLDARLALDSRNSKSELESQIILCLLDQVYHSKLPRDGTDTGTAAGETFDSTRIYQQTYNAYASIPEPAGTAWQGFFGHLFGYGATYYSYLFDRVLAGRIWGEVFKNGMNGGGLDRGNGEKYKEEVLRWGGGRDGWECLAGVLGDEVLKGGGERAMREVGRWGIREGKGV